MTEVSSYLSTSLCQMVALMLTSLQGRNQGEKWGGGGGGTKAKKKKMGGGGGGPELKKKKYNLNFFFFWNWGGPWPPPVPPPPQFRHCPFGKRNPLPWAMRYKISLGLASALLYLHEEWEQCVVHRDIKSSNVMLDSSFGVKLGDFGLARLMNHEVGPQTSRLAGTL
jgi:hypothetical protein